ncbi:MAG: hypothetical protein GOMPHAMPRED_000110 [Gomphillus americanus]|uniref:Uncharacterized protein n=1 Tax=Gomphillus americanus TaxID=1940652 RepID=A0A8H3I4N5_9LECA|nr:MAG: hypothetical protein GOMPHAMPRED_000110 [Gomphillus americanus]
MLPVEISRVDTSIEAKLISALEYPTGTPSPRQSAARRSGLHITTVSEVSTTPFCPTPTPKSATSRSLPSAFSKPPPEIPSRWLWRCHLCSLSYPIGTTRRCLNDGHYFCAGTTINKRTGKKKPHSPCGSTFDYIGWQEYGDWRRHERDLRAKAANTSLPPKPFRTGPLKKPTRQTSSSSKTKETNLMPNPHFPAPTLIAPPTQPNCEHNCNFPSECRWRAATPQSPPSTNTTNLKRSTRTKSPTNFEVVSSTTEAASSPAVQQQQEKPLSQEFHLGKTSVRRQMSFSLPFSVYAWLMAPAADAMSDVTPEAAPVESSASDDAAEAGERESADEQLWLVPVLRCELA